jgi:hypothetical protein
MLTSTQYGCHVIDEVCTTLAYSLPCHPPSQLPCHVDVIIRTATPVADVVIRIATPTVDVVIRTTTLSTNVMIRTAMSSADVIICTVTSAADIIVRTATSSDTVSVLPCHHDDVNIALARHPVRMTRGTLLLPRQHANVNIVRISPVSPVCRKL